MLPSSKRQMATKWCSLWFWQGLSCGKSPWRWSHLASRNAPAPKPFNSLTRQKACLFFLVSGCISLKRCKPEARSITSFKNTLCQSSGTYFLPSLPVLTVTLKPKYVSKDSNSNSKKGDSRKCSNLSNCKVCFSTGLKTLTLLNSPRWLKSNSWRNTSIWTYWSLLIVCWLDCTPVKLRQTPRTATTMLYLKQWWSRQSTNFTLWMRQTTLTFVHVLPQFWDFKCSGVKKAIKARLLWSRISLTLLGNERFSKTLTSN